MKRFLLLLPALLILLAGCPSRHATTSVSGEQSVSSTTSSGSTVQTVVLTDTTVVAPDTSKARCVISFISRGQGTDVATKDNLQKWLTKHPDVKYKVIHWGKEGECDYELLIHSRTAADQQKIIAEIKTLVGNNDRVLISENTEPHAARPEEIPPMAVEQVDSNIVRLVVSFISKGEGIDYQTLESFEKWVAERPQFIYTKSTWGREGEVNLCFRMDGRNSREQEIFIRDVRTFLSDKSLVLISEWEKCDKRK